MTLTQSEERVIAHRLRIKPEELDAQALNAARDAVDRKTVDAYDAMADADQMLDNLDRLTAIAIVYDFI